MKAIFLGTPPAAVPSLRAIVDSGHDVPLVVTQPDRPAGRSREPLPPPVKQAAIEMGLSVVQPTKVRTGAFVDALASHRPDVLVVVAYGRILVPPVLAVPRLGAVNVHFSLLPELRGAAPVQWALARGFERTGVTTMAMNEKMDEGDILLQRDVDIGRGEHAPSLAERLSRAGSDLLVETLDGLEAGRITARAQRHDDATLAPRLARDDGDGTPSMAAPEIEGRVRGFDPWPGVWLLRGGRRLRLIGAVAIGGSPGAESPGTLVETTARGVVMACGEGTRLLLLEVQPEGRRRMSALDAVNGRQLAVGDRLEAPAKSG